MDSGDLFVISAPSGAGKTTLCLRLVRELSGVSFSVSHTTRAPREGEVDGVDYHFVSQYQFDQMVDAEHFLEWARVHSHCYGTSASEVLGRLGRGEDVLLDIDVQGARQVRKISPQAVLIFVLPPSWAVLEERLRRRGTDEPAAVRARLANARAEIAAVHEYDFIIVNDEIDQAAGRLRAIVSAHRCRRGRVLADPRLVTAFGFLPERS